MSEDIPEELRRALEARPEALAVFSKLPPSHRRQHIGFVAEAKRPETRQRRAARTLEMLLQPQSVVSGYSGTPLPQKLGLKAGMLVHFLDAPPGYEQAVAIDGLQLSTEVSTEVSTEARPGLDFAQIFVTQHQQLLERLAATKDAIVKNGMIWVSWPKRTSGLDTNLTENIIRAEALALGLVDVKVASIDSTWSGLKLVYRVRDR